jgi:hypothetical protein
VTAAAVLAHQGGWDEVAFIAGPLIVIGIVAWVGRRRERDEDPER